MRISTIITDIVQIINRSHSDLQNLDADDHTQYLDVAGTRPPRNIKFGNYADKPASPQVGDLYYAIDHNKIYGCKEAGSWLAVRPATHKETHLEGAIDEIDAAQLKNSVHKILTEHGDILFRGASGLQRLPAGNPGQFLKTQGAGADPVWDSLEVNFGSPESKDFGVEYQAPTAGIVVAYFELDGGEAKMEGYIGESSANMCVARDGVQQAYGNASSITFPVPKNWYWKVLKINISSASYSASGVYFFPLST